MTGGCGGSDPVNPVILSKDGMVAVLGLLDRRTRGPEGERFRIP